ncbi:P-loop ATPase, Sll1717 family [Cohnella yongneupensis]|uniref:P-loop ATPase, Sll1717 family n=1 Tax=Cohnella yongneupensis TaxID=425006 RepID=A0ABW0QT16_9BACL
MTVVTGFYAYPSHPSDLNETVKTFIEKVNSSGIVKITSWKDLQINGTFIIDNILEAIDSADLFICDLTYLNNNVLFELGFAIAKNKKVWITLDPNIDIAKRDYEKLRILTTIGYSPYSNYQTLHDQFYKDQPYENLSKTILSQTNSGSIEGGKLLFLKSPIDSDASLALSVRLKESPIGLVIDDPKEISTQPLSWYIRYLTDAFGVIVHFASDKHTESSIINAKYSLISGLSRAMNKPLIMLAHEPFNSPIDYRDTLKIHSTSKQCLEHLINWIEPLNESFRQKQTKYDTHLKNKKALTDLQSLFIGEPIAEHESDSLTDYFFETREYSEALNSQQTLFVGRKGTGKTANFYKIADELSQDKRNYVCVIQPVGHEIEGVLNMLKQGLPNSEKGYLVESIWKYLIYTELAKSVYASIKSRPSHIMSTADENDFVSFVKKNEKMINADFTLRLENAVTHLYNLTEYKSIESHRIRVSEILHDNMINQLRGKLGQILENKNKVCILIDNLDASWNPRNDLNELCLLLFGLLNVLKKITDEFTKADYRYKKVNLSLIAFLRSDIFNQILAFANERDKIQHSKLVWQDAEQLFRIIENRIEFSVEGITSPQELWENYFCSHIVGKPLKAYVSSLILPRPRDIIFLFRGAIHEAVNRGHTKVEEEDFLSAELKYSQYALESLLPEIGNRLDDLESILYEFAGATEIISMDEVENILKGKGITNTAEVIDILCELTFLGLETNPNVFEFISEHRSKKIVFRLAEKTVHQSQTKVQRFKIHNAFHAYLDIN